MPIAQVEGAQPDGEPPFASRPGPAAPVAPGGGPGSSRLGRAAMYLLVLAAVGAVVLAYLGRVGPSGERGDGSDPDPVPSRQAGATEADDPAAPGAVEAQGVIGSPTVAPPRGDQGERQPVEAALVDQTTPGQSDGFERSSTAGRPPIADDGTTGTTLDRQGTTTTTAGIGAVTSALRPTSSAARTSTTDRTTTTTSARVSTSTSASPRSTTRAPTTTVAVSPDPAPRPPSSVPTAVDWALGASGQTSSAVLPLDRPLASGALANYDVDRDGAPGLLLQKGGGPGETDPVKVQRWWLALPTGIELAGQPILQQWVAVKDFDRAKTGRLDVRLYDCAAVRTDCRLLASGRASVRQAAFGADFGMVTVALPELDRQVTPGRGVALEITVPSSSDDDMWFAYGTRTYDSRLTIG